MKTAQQKVVINNEGEKEFFLTFQEVTDDPHKRKRKTWRQLMPVRRRRRPSLVTTDNVVMAWAGFVLLPWGSPQQGLFYVGWIHFIQTKFWLRFAEEQLVMLHREGETNGRRAS